MSDKYDLLREPFPDAAHSADTSRGFELTSIKAAYIFERLNEVFGLCGTGWRYAHKPIEIMTNEAQGVEFVTEVALQYRVEAGQNAIMWDHEVGKWIIIISDNAEWSAPIFAFGGKKPSGGGAPFTDAHKSALTDALTKAASMLGVGQDVFKGERKAVRGGQHQPRQATQAYRERATKPAQTSGDGKQKFPDRPWNAATTRVALHKKAGTGTTTNDPPASEKQIPLVARLFQEVWTDDEHAEQKYHSCLVWIWGVDSATKLSLGQASATISWLKAGDESWDLSPMAIAEANSILTEAMKDAGQQELPLDDAVETHQAEFEELAT